jgi:hypothetical protein
MEGESGGVEKSLGTRGDVRPDDCMLMDGMVRSSFSVECSDRKGEAFTDSGPVLE